MTTVAADLPGAELALPGLEDLAHGRVTREALLVARATDRLRAAGIAVPDHDHRDPDGELYRLLAMTEDDPHATYNALTGRLLSLLDALDRAPRR